MLSILLFFFVFKEEDEVAKAETEEKIIDSNGDLVCVPAAKHIIEYCITFHYSTIFSLFANTFFHSGLHQLKSRIKSFDYCSQKIQH